jgi:hypothetical protein
MNTRIVITILLILVSAQLAFATAQSPDKLIYKGEKFALFANPLQDYYHSFSPADSTIYPNFDTGGITSYSTGCWRGYIATWEIKNDTLYLIKIEDCSDEGKTFDLTKIFSSKVKKGRVKADWYSGELRIPKGKMVEYVHMGYMSKYERELTLEIEKGVLLYAEEFKYEPKEAPKGFEEMLSLRITAFIPENMQECYEPITDTICFKNKEYSLYGFEIKQPSEWLNSNQQKEFVNHVIDSCITYYSKGINFDKPVFEKQRLGHVGWVDGKLTTGDKWLRVFTIAKRTSSYIIVFRSESGAKSTFVSNADIFCGSISFIEFGF